MNPYVDKEGYLCLNVHIMKSVGICNGGNTMGLIDGVVQKRYKVNTQTGLFEECVTE